MLRLLWRQCDFAERYAKYLWLQGDNMWVIVTVVVTLLATCVREENAIVDFKLKISPKFNKLYGFKLENT